MENVLVNKRALHREAFLYIITALASLGLLTLVMHLWNANWNIPFAYSKDALFTAMLVKTVSEQGWYLHNPALGAPGAQNLLDFPLTDQLHLLALRGLCAVLPSWGAALNVFYVLTFPLAAVSALWVFRRCGLAWPGASVGSLLFAFLPYHFLHGEAHVFLSMYALVPPVILLCLWIYAGEGFCRTRRLVSIAVCLGLAWTGVYYAVFGIYLLIIAGIVAALREGNARRLWPALLLAGVVGAGMLAAVMPSLWYWHGHGRNPSVARRLPQEAELYSLKLAQMVLPVTDHRLPGQARLKDRYNDGTLFVNENDFGTLGLVGACGFVILLGALVIRRKWDALSPHLEGASVLTAFAVLLGTLGGLGSLLAVVVSPEIRAYDRISIFIAFLALFAVVACLDALARATEAAQGSKMLYNSLLLLILILGVADQTSPDFAPNYRALQAAYQTDGQFTHQLEASAPAGAAIFQLPYAPFPEGGPVGHMTDYQILRPALHSARLRWSAGAMRGRPADLWQRGVSSEPTTQMLSALSAAGFAGITVDTQGYSDGGAKLCSALTMYLGAPTVQSRDRRLLYFPLHPNS